MSRNPLLMRTVAVLVGIAALLFIFGEAMSVWRAMSEAKKADVEAAALAANRDLVIEKKRAQLLAGVKSNFDRSYVGQDAVASKKDRDHPDPRGLPPLKTDSGAELAKLQPDWYAARCELGLEPNADACARITLQARCQNGTETSRTNCSGFY
jgi:hypothetical protein